MRNRFAWDFLGKYFLSMTLQAVAFFLMTLAIEFKAWKWRPDCLKGDLEAPEAGNDDDAEDEDVRRERERVSGLRLR